MMSEEQAISYRATEPEYNAITRFTKAFSRIIGAPYYLIRSGVNELFGHLMADLVLPAQEDTSKDSDRYKKILDAYKKKLNERCIPHPQSTQVITADGAVLDGIQLIHENKNPGDADTPTSQKANYKANNNYYLIKFNGNGTAYEETMDEIVKDYKKGYNVITFNPRGVGKSKPPKYKKLQSKDELIKDGVAQVERLLKQSKVAAKNIIIDGHSLGAAYGTLVADYFYSQRKKKAKINLLNSCSFSSLTNWVTGEVKEAGKRAALMVRGFFEKKRQRLNKNYPNSQYNHFLDYLRPLRALNKLGMLFCGGLGRLLGKTIQWLADGFALGIVKPLAKTTLLLTHWEMDAGSAFKRLPNERKAYFHIREPDKIRKAFQIQTNKDGNYEIKAQPYAKGDGVIPPYASIARAMEYQNPISVFIKAVGNDLIPSYKATARSQTTAYEKATNGVEKATMNKCTLKEHEKEHGQEIRGFYQSSPKMKNLYIKVMREEGWDDTTIIESMRRALIAKKPKQMKNHVSQTYDNNASSERLPLCEKNSKQDSNEYFTTLDANSHRRLGHDEDRQFLYNEQDKEKNAQDFVYAFFDKIKKVNSRKTCAKQTSKNVKRRSHTQLSTNNSKKNNSQLTSNNLTLFHNLGGSQQTTNNPNYQQKKCCPIM
jgi:hypothetical protein